MLLLLLLRRPLRTIRVRWQSRLDRRSEPDIDLLALALREVTRLRLRLRLRAGAVPDLLMGCCGQQRATDDTLLLGRVRRTGGGHTLTLRVDWGPG